MGGLGLVKRKRVMRRDKSQLAHFGPPVLFLLAVTIVVLIIHSAFSGGTNSTSTVSTYSTTTPPTTTSAKPKKIRIYTIRAGDTLGAVAIHFSVTVDDIMALNPGIDPNALRVGQKIKVGKAPVEK
jgi:LysM repeat protein